MWWKTRPERPATPEAGQSDEAVIERYVERPTPLRDWLEAKLRNAPWWCISLLVHLIALMVLWSWPARSSAEADVTLWTPPVGIIEEPTRDERRDIDDKRPDEIPDVPEKFKIRDEPETTVAGGPKVDELPPVDTPPPAGGEERAPIELFQLMTPVIGPEVFDPHLLQSKQRFGPGRDKLRQKIGSWGTGTGPSVGPGGETDTVVPPLVAALMWLARAQDRDGSWDAKRWDGASPYKVGMVGLGLLAFQGAGITHQKGKYRQTVLRALEWLRENQRRDGSFPWETFYEQGIATMAVCEAYGVTQDPKLRPMAQHAIDYIVKLQPEHGGFRYSGPVIVGEGDMSVTGWQIMAIKSAILAGLNVPSQAIERSRLFLKNTWRDYGASSYLAGERPAGSLAVTAIGFLCRTFLNDGGIYDAEIGQTLEFLRQRENPNFSSPAGGASKELVSDIYYTYYSSLAVYQIGGDATEHWRSWRTMYRAPLVAAQVQDERDARGRFIMGSWDPAKHRWGDRGGRVYATAMGALCLEAPFRYLPTSRLKK